ncbi:MULTISPECIES: TonB-dependent siderophore receptor [unclassified Sphingomonas]|uniref:TonB-dependent siderophore receptor n=1 Tax=unclassified Sphingomonas TaxID=196159 RepID=UPI000A87B688|nr:MULTISPECIES: TonB-dependent siderophore receptor [unclassified Sphingomonas]
MRNRQLLFLSAAALAFTMPVAATAQDVAATAGVAAAATADAEPDQQADIVVQGQRQQYVANVPTIEVPQSIQILSAATLKDAGITRLDNALDFATGIARQNNFGGLFDVFACRGFTGDEGTASNYLVNGFNGARGYGGSRDMSNVEQVQVLKGPNSSLFGRGEPGCTVNIITKKPGFDLHGGAILSAGSFNNYRSEGDVNVPLSSKIAVRVTGAAESADSFRDFISSQKVTVTPSVLVKLGRDSSASYEFEYIDQKVMFDRGIVAPGGNLSLVPRERFFGEPGDGPVHVRAKGHQAQLQHDFSSDWSLVLGVGYRDTFFKGTSTEAELAAGRQRLYTDGTTLSRQRRARDYSTTDLTFRGELSGEFATGSLTHHMIVGADWDQYELDVIQNRYRPPLVASQAAGNLVAGNRVDIFNPVYGKQPATGTFQSYLERQFSWGGYLQDQVDVTDALKVRFGGRYDEFEQVIDERVGGRRTQQFKTAFSPSVGATYLIGDALSIYANYGRGFRPNNGTDANNNPFLPERTESYEAGAKVALFHNRLTGTVALFRTTKSNVLTADPVNANFSLAVGRAQSKGVEAELSGNLPAGFRVQFNYAYIDATVAQDALDPNFGFGLRKGDPLLNIAKNSGSALIFKDFDIGSSRLTLGAGVNYVGRRLGETGYRFPNGDFYYLPGYTLTRLTAAFEPTDRIRVSGEVTNLFDKQYFPSSYSRLWTLPGAPRQFMVRVGYSY